MAVHHGGGLLLLILSLLSTSCYVEGWGNCAFTRDQFLRVCCIKTTEYCTCNYELTELRKCLDREGRKPPCKVYTPPNEIIGCCKKWEIGKCLCMADRLCPRKLRKKPNKLKKKPKKPRKPRRLKNRKQKYIGKIMRGDIR